MDAAEQAYEAAKAEIARVKAAGEDTLYLNGGPFVELSHIPDEIVQLKYLKTLLCDDTQIFDLSPLVELSQLQELFLRRTKVIDLAPLSEMNQLKGLALGETLVSNLEPIKGLRNLDRLDLRKTKVKDISPLASLENLRDLHLRRTEVSDLRPLIFLEKLGKDAFFGLEFTNTAAALEDLRIANLAEIEFHFDRAQQTLAYLRSLPPWPEPYTPAATPDGSPPKPIGGLAERQKINTAQTQIQHLIRNATVTRVTAQAFASQIEEALRDVPATHGNQLAEPLQTMQEFAVALRNLAPANEPVSDPLQRAQLELRISQLEALVDRLILQLADETKAREAAEALAKKDGFWSNYKQGAGKTAGVATVSLATVGVPTAAVFFLGVEHPLVQAFLTVMGRLPKS